MTRVLPAWIAINAAAPWGALGTTTSAVSRGGPGAPCSPSGQDCYDGLSCVVTPGATIGQCQPSTCDCDQNQCGSGYACTSTGIFTTCQQAGTGGTDLCSACQTNSCINATCLNYDFCTCNPSDPSCGGDDGSGDDCAAGDDICNVDECVYDYYACQSGNNGGSGGGCDDGGCQALPVRGGIPIPDVDPNLPPSRAVQRSTDTSHPMSYALPTPPALRMSGAPAGRVASLHQADQPGISRSLP